jgi:hypothetical protein
MPSVYVTYLGIPDEFLYRLVGVVVLTVPFLYIVWKKTKGGWRWRRGDEDESAEENGVDGSPL